MTQFNTADKQRHAARDEQLRGVLDHWCWMWSPEERARVRAEFQDWMRSCDRADSRGLTAFADYVANALAAVKRGDWSLRPVAAAYVKCREQFYGYAAEAYSRRFPIHGPFPQEDDDVPF